MPDCVQTESVCQSVAFLTEAGLARVDVAIVLGSGMSAVVQHLGLEQCAPYATVPGWPTVRVAGHAGTLHWGTVSGQQVLVASGRVHLYEGRGLDPVVYLPRVAAALGCRTLLLTAAVGGLRPSARPGDMVIIRDHLDTTWHRLTAPLAPHGSALPFCGYSRQVCERLHRAAAQAGISVEEGCYAFCCGPQYETAAEIQLLQRWGATVVGMSTVPEVVEACRLGVPTGALGVITNLGTGISPCPHDHTQVNASAQTATQRLARLLDRFLLIA